jgi:hypothetical protein
MMAMLVNRQCINLDDIPHAVLRFRPRVLLDCLYHPTILALIQLIFFVPSLIFPPMA